VKKTNLNVEIEVCNEKIDEKEVEITIDGFTGKVLAVLVEPADNHDD